MGMIIIDALIKTRRSVSSKWVTGGWMSVVETKVLATNDPTGAWSEYTRPVGRINSLGYGNGNWVGVGGSGFLITAPDPTGTWTLRPAYYGPYEMMTVAYGNGNWVAAGGTSTFAHSGRIMTATDPTGTWTVNGFAGYAVYCASYGDGNWVASCYGGRVMTATDPTGTWTLSSTLASLSPYFHAVAYGNGKWVGVGGAIGAGKIATATDPTGAWTVNPVALAWLPKTVGYGNGKWVVAGDSGGKMVTATDPTGAWTVATSGFQPNDQIRKVLYNGIWVAIGGASPIYGTTTRISTAIDPTGVWTPQTAPTYNILHGLATNI